MDNAGRDGEGKIAGQRILAVNEEELQRIVLDIHDGPVQKLFAALSQVNILQQHLRRGHTADLTLEVGLNRVAFLLENSLNDIRTFLGTFRAPEFAKHDLISVLEALIVQFEAMTGDRVELQVTGDLPPVPLPVKIALYRIVQEAISNSYRHSGSAEQRVRLWCEGDYVWLEVSDQGAGFIPPQLNGPGATEREEHIGLRGMRDRVNLIGGTMDLWSQPGRGTRVTVKVPCHV